MVLLLSTLWKKDKGERVDFALRGFCCLRQKSRWHFHITVLSVSHSSSVTNLVNSCLSFPQETPEISHSSVVFRWIKAGKSFSG